MVTVADVLAAAVAVSLPWSTSATGILVALWLAAIIATLDSASIRREAFTLPGGLPLLLCLLGALGMLWADVGIGERLHGFTSFLKFLVIPLLLAQFRRSGNGVWATNGFLISGAVLLCVSPAHALLWDRVAWHIGETPGVPVKDYISQGGVFQLCMFGSAYAATDAWRQGRYRLAVALLTLALCFLTNLAFVTVSRTAVAAMSVLTIVWGLRQFGWKGTMHVFAAAAVLAAMLWTSSPYLQARLRGTIDEIRQYQSENAITNAGLRLEFWRKSLGFFREAPLIGHGTGSINDLFRKSVTGTTGASSIASTNPHQQILGVAIQLGAVGTVVLLGFWISHAYMFIRPGLAAFCGLILVMQNVVSSLFNSHLFDFTQGWIYVVGVGVCGGMVLHESDRSTRP